MWNRPRWILGFCFLEKSTAKIGLKFWHNRLFRKKPYQKLQNEYNRLTKNLTE
jgi:hypothetical protein